MNIEDKNAIMNRVIKANPDVSVGEYNRICGLLEVMSNRAKELFWENYGK